MGFLDRFRTKSAAANAMVMYRGGQAAPRTTNLASLAKEGYGRNPDVFAVVNGITSAAKGVEWKLLKLSSRAVRAGWTPMQVRKQLHVARTMGGVTAGRRKQRELVKAKVLVPVPDHALLDLLAKPNPLQDWSEFIEALLGFYCVTGNWFINGVGPDNPLAPPQELWPLRPDRIKIIVGDSATPVRGYQYGPNGNGEMLPFETVLHGKTWNPTDDFWGLSPIMAAARRIDWQNAAEDWNLGLVQNGGMPAGAVVVQETLNPEQRKDMSAWVDENYSGPKNAGRPLLLEGGMDWKDIGMTPGDAAWLEGDANATRKIAHVLNWPSVLVGDSSDKTYSNYGEARKAGIEEGVLPKLDFVANKLNTWLVPRFGPDLLLAYDADDIEVLQEDRDKVWARVERATHLSINEKRELTGQEPRPDGDVILVPATMIPLGVPKAATGTAKGGLVPDIGKAIGFRTMDQKEAWYGVMEAQRERLEGTVEGMVRDTLDAERDAAVAAAKHASTAFAVSIAVERALTHHRAAWEQTLKQAYLTVGGVFARQVVDQLHKDAGTPYGMTKDDAEDTWQNYVLEWLAKEAPNKSRQITDTSMDAIRAAVGAGIAEGDSIPKIAARISEVYDAGTPYRATMIARTETVAASNLGSRSGAKATGLPLRKEWLATPGPRTRETHAIAGSTYATSPIGMDDPFTVGTAQLQFPGDSSLGAPAGEVVNCRCTEVYTVVE